MVVQNRPQHTTTLAVPAEAGGTVSDARDSKPVPQELPVRRLAIPLKGGILSVLVEQSGPEVVVTEIKSGLFGEGRTEGEAITDLYQHLRIILRDLTQTKRLSPEMEDERQRLSGLLG